MPRFVRSVVTTCLLLSLLNSVAHAQRGGGERGGGGRRGGFGGEGGGLFGGGGGGGLLGVAMRTSTQAELKLTAEQIQQIEDLQTSLRPDPNTFRERMEGLSQEERTAFFEEIRAEGEVKRQAAEAQLDKVLRPEQLARLKQLELHTAGLGALSRADLATTLQLTDDQKAKIAAATAAYDEQRRGGGFRMSREERDALLQTRNDALQAVLTDAQKTQWTSLQGPPPAESAATATPEPPRGPRGPGVRVGGTSGSTPTRTPVVEAAPPADAVAVAEFAPQAAETDDPEAKKMSFNFRFAPWDLVLQHFAKEADLTLDLGVVPPGTFNYFDRRTFTPTEALDILNGYLLQKGYLLIRRDRFLVVVNVDDGIPPNLVPQVSLRELPQRGKNELMTIVIPLRELDPEVAATDVESLLGPQGKVVPVNTTKRLVVTDVGSNLQRIVDMLVGEGETGAKASGFRAFQVKHISVLEAERVVRDLFGLQPRGTAARPATSGPQPYSREWYAQLQQQGRGPGGGPPQAPPPAQPASKSTLQVAVDQRTNSLLVTANPEELAIVEDAIKAIDVESGDAASFTGTQNPQLEVYQLTSADPLVVVQLLNTLVPGLTIQEDAKAKRISVYAGLDDQKQVKEIIRQLDGDGGAGVSVIPLTRLDPVAAAASLKALYKDKEGPAIEADVVGARLIIRGTAEQLAQVKSVLQQLGEDGTGRREVGIGGPIRTIPLGGRDPQQFLSLLQQMWGAQETTPIRVVVPSAVSPMLNRKAPLPPQTPTDDDAPSDEATPAVPPVSKLQIGPGAPRPAVRRPAAESRPAPESAPPADKFPPDANRTGGVRVRPVAQSSETEPEAEAETEDTPRRAGTRPPAAGDPAEPQILIAPNGNSLIIASDDLEALDRLERMVQLLAAASPNRRTWTVFYLRSADATETATMLGALFPTSSVSQTAKQEGGGMLGSVTQSLGSFGSSLMDMTGVSSLGTGGGTLRIVPELRSNALFITGPAEQVREIEEVLKILDSSELPQTLRDRVPRSIPVLHADLEDVADVVESVYKDYMTAPNQGMNLGGRGGGNPLAMLMGAAQGGEQKQGRGIRLTLGLDKQTNTLIVSADDSLFKQISALVQQLDTAALEANRTVRVVSLQNANSVVIQQALGSLLPKVKVSTTGSPPVMSDARSRGNRTERSDRGNRGGEQGNSGGGGGGGDEEIRRMFEQRIRERFMQDAGLAPPSGGDEGGFRRGGRGGRGGR